MEAIVKLLKGKNLTFNEAKALFDEMLKGNLKETVTSAVLVALNLKGITPEELASAIVVARENMVKVKVEKYLVDTCGTGGDGKKTANISTISALMLRSLGYNVAKHGNRKVTGFLGSIDLAEKVNLPIASTKEEALKNLEELGFCILFARTFHPAFGKFAALRTDLKVPTVFNILGPLVNPALPKAQLIGVFSKERMRTIAQALYELGDFDRVIVHSETGFDEVVGNAETYVYEVRKEGIREWTFDPKKVLGKSVEPPTVSSEEEALIEFKKAITQPESNSAVTCALNSAFTVYAAGKEEIDRAYTNTIKAIKDGTVLETFKMLGGVI